MRTNKPKRRGLNEADAFQMAAEEYAVRRLHLFQVAISAATQQSLLEDNIELGPAGSLLGPNSNASVIEEPQVHGVTPPVALKASREAYLEKQRKRASETE